MQLLPQNYSEQNKVLFAERKLSTINSNAVVSDSNDPPVTAYTFCPQPVVDHSDLAEGGLINHGLMHHPQIALSEDITLWYCNGH